MYKINLWNEKDLAVPPINTYKALSTSIGTKKKYICPLKDLLDYILVRLQGIGKLMERLVESSKIAAYLLDKRMHTGHFWKIAFIMFSKLLPFSSQLKNTGSGWLPPSYILPQDLGKWMDVDWLEFDEEVQIVGVPTEIPDIMKFFDLVDDDDDVQFCEEYLMIEDDEDDEAEIHFNEANDYKAKIPFTQRLSQLRGFDNSEDIGEVIDIEDSLVISDNKYSANSKNIKKRYFESTSENTEKVEVTEDVKEDKSVIEIAADYNVDPVDSAQERAKAEENVTIPDTSIMEITGDYKTCDKAHSISEQKIKNRLNIVTDETLLVPNSESDNSSDDNDEENILTVSDVSLIEVPDDDSMTVVTSTPKNRNNGSIGRERKNLNVTLKHSKINEDENVIIIPDTPGVETNMKREKTKAKKKATNSDTLIKLSDDEDKSVILVNEEEEPENDNGHITLDDPIKRTQSDIKKEKIKLRNLVKKLNKLKRHKHTAQNPNTLIKTNKLKKLASKISEPLKLNSNDTIMHIQKNKTNK
ncbi:hypothetical protein NQ318_020812 [Aromia moschata]|uniref:Nucleolus and neural progenitor protein-like N-terminal domain-containing protein n=1 Tax=Aromia moschata TaxID=1265417 RepID=A0AAV8Y5H6_9CUCU|nr:hypothetical protein NQ318_020812 [Aromia moschata]